MESWSDGAAYEPYVGRWSRPVARAFVGWLGLPPAARWLDVGCGTGALTQTLLDAAAPAAVLGVDPSQDFLELAQAQVLDPRATFHVGDAQALPVEDAAFDVVVSGLVLNFVPDRARALGEMRRAVIGGGTVAAYVWDYGGGAEFLSRLWDAAVELDPAARPLHEGVRFDFCRPDALQQMLVDAGFADVETTELVVPTTFRDFDDYWSRFLSGRAPAPAYVQSLEEAQRQALRDALHARLPVAADGSIALSARAWGVRGVSRG